MILFRPLLSATVGVSKIQQREPGLSCRPLPVVSQYSGKDGLVQQIEKRIGSVCYEAHEQGMDCMIAGGEGNLPSVNLPLFCTGTDLMSSLSRKSLT